MHNLFLVYFVNVYRFQAHRGPSSGGTTVCIQQLVWYLLFLLDDCPLSWLDWKSNQDNRQSSKKNNNYQLFIQTVVPPDDGPR